MDFTFQATIVTQACVAQQLAELEECWCKWCSRRLGSRVLDGFAPSNCRRMVGQEPVVVTGAVARESAWLEIGELQLQHAAIQGRLRFIREAAEGKLNIFARTREELLDSLAKAGYPPGEDGGFGYLLSTDVSSMLVDGVQRLERKRDDTLARIKNAKACAALYAREQLNARIGALEKKKLRFKDVLSMLTDHKVWTPFPLLSADVHE